MIEKFPNVMISGFSPKSLRRKRTRTNSSNIKYSVHGIYNIWIYS